MTRSVWKGPFIDNSLLKAYKRYKAENKSGSIKTWSRRSVILPQFVGITFEVYNGKSFLKVHVTEDMVGHKFGEFADTRKIGKR